MTSRLYACLVSSTIYYQFRNVPNKESSRFIPSVPTRRANLFPPSVDTSDLLYRFTSYNSADIKFTAITVYYI